MIELCGHLSMSEEERVDYLGKLQDYKRAAAVSFSSVYGVCVCVCVCRR